MTRADLTEQVYQAIELLDHAPGVGIFQLASSHPPGAAAAVPPHVAEFVLFVLFFDFRRLHGLRERRRPRVPVIGASLAALLHVGSFALSTAAPS